MLKTSLSIALVALATTGCATKETYFAENTAEYTHVAMLAEEFRSHLSSGDIAAQSKTVGEYVKNYWSRHCTSNPIKNENEDDYKCLNDTKNEALMVLTSARNSKTKSYSVDLKLPYKVNFDKDILTISEIPSFISLENTDIEIPSGITNRVTAKISDVEPIKNLYPLGTVDAKIVISKPTSQTPMTKVSKRKSFHDALELHIDVNGEPLKIKLN